MTVPSRDGGKPQGPGAVQYAALPFRRESALEILLITSRDTGRWVIPKGWPMKGRKPHSAAAVEAMEEAGVKGLVGKEPIGAYRYFKLQDNGAQVRCRVRVYPLEVLQEWASWPEMGERERRWFPPAEAAELVDEPDLKRLILAFAEKQEADLRAKNRPEAG